jgi:hypothetical protein
MASGGSLASNSFPDCTHDPSVPMPRICRKAGCVAGAEAIYRVPCDKRRVHANAINVNDGALG